VVPVEGGDPATVFELGSVLSPSWSPEGDRFAMTLSMDKAVGLYSIKKDGSDLQPLLEDDWKNTFPRWSPDGKSLLYYSDRGGQGAVCVLDTRAGESQILTLEAAEAQTSWALVDWDSVVGEKP
jgi:Tol biopolymer transport system component